MHRNAADTLSVSSSHVVLQFIYCELFTVCLDTSCSSRLSAVQNVHFLHWSKLPRVYIFVFFGATFGSCNFVQVT